MNVARLNFSHGSHADHEAVYRPGPRGGRGRRPSRSAILADLQGPKIRLGRFADGPHEWRTGDIGGDHRRRHRRHQGPGLLHLPASCPQEVKPGDRLLIDDGKVAVEVSDVDRQRHPLPGHRGRPGLQQQGRLAAQRGGQRARRCPTRTPRTCASPCGSASTWSRSPSSARPRTSSWCTTIMAEEGVRRPVLAKVEKPEAVDHLEAIVRAFDGVMVARGDLGVEMPLDQVPLVQKRAVQLCRENAKPVIVATQMLDSMIENSRPTRAEASDVANAVLDGADAVMLSGETSVGKYPVLTVSTMAKIVTTTEAGSIGVPRLQHDPRTRGGALTVAASSDRPGHRRQGAGRLLADRRHRTPAGPAALRPAAAGVHPGAGGAQPARPLAGAWRRSWCRSCSTPTTCSARSTRRCSALDRAEPGRLRGDRGGQPARHPRLDQHPAGAPARLAGRRRPTGAERCSDRTTAESPIGQAAVDQLLEAARPGAARATMTLPGR